MTCRCPHCGKALSTDPNARFQHVKAKHGRGAAKVFRQPREPAEQSVADELIEAIKDHAAGIKPPAHLRSMFPGSFDG